MAINYDVEYPKLQRRIATLEETISTIEDNAEAEQRELDLVNEVAKLERRIINLEGWNKEMYENHQIEVNRLRALIDKSE